MRNSIMLAGTVLLAVSISASAISADALQRYEINMELKDAGKLIGNPRLIVTAGNEAKFHISEKDGPSYTATVMISPQTETVVAVDSKFIAEYKDNSKRSSHYTLSVNFESSNEVVVGDNTQDNLNLEMKFKIIKVVS
jgi:hypothetical protein